MDNYRQNSPHFRTLPKSTLNFYKSIPYPFKFLANISISLKTLLGPQYGEACAGTARKDADHRDRTKKLLKGENNACETQMPLVAHAICKC